MEAVQRLVRSLKSGRSDSLPEDPKAAYYMLLTYVMQNQYRTITDLLGSSSSFEINFALGKSKRTLLHMAANVGAYESMVFLLKKGAVPNVPDRQGITPIQVAARNGFVKCIVKLLDYGADLEIKNNEGMTAIHWLAANGRTEVLNEIMKYIRNIDVEDDRGQTPLHVACQNGHIATIRKLFELKADIEKSNVHGCTPLFIACSQGHANVVEELLQRHASLKINQEKESPLDIALKGGHGKVCKLLITHYPKLLTTVLAACQRKDMEIEKIKEVLSYICACDVHLKDEILFKQAQNVSVDGLNLLSQSADCSEMSEKFIKTVSVFTYLLAFNPHSRNVSPELRRTYELHSELMQNDLRKPDNLTDIENELASLWRVLESWMKLLQQEINGEDDVASCCSASPRNEIVEKTRLHSFANALKRNSSLKLDRQVSKTSLSLEQLRLIQPAMEFNMGNEDERLAQAVTNNEDPDLNEGASSGYYRSESYRQAVQFNFDDELEEQAAENRISYSDILTGEVVTDIENEGMENVNGEDNSHVLDSSAFTQDPLQKTFLNGDSGFGRSPKNSNVFEITSDRLCSVIHGYHLYCDAKPLWGDSKKQIFDQFLVKHENVMHLLVSRKPELIFEHFNFVFKNPVTLQRFLPAIHAQPFKDRVDWFYKNLHEDKKRASVMLDEQSILTVTRDSLLQTSCEQMTGKTAERLKKNVVVRFTGEEGMGAGVVREWLDLLIKQMLNPDFALFTLSADGSTFQPNRNSSINPDHLSYFEFAGRIMGMALYHKHLITAYFTRSFYKHILGIPVSYADVESIDPEYSKNLQWILDHDITNLGLDITFLCETDVFGQMQEIELKPNGRNITVTEENKVEYVHLAADLRMTKAIKPQILSFLSGFYQFIPLSLVSLFNEYELELLLSGLPEFDLKDWKKHTSYQAGYEKDDQMIQWFWDVVQEFSKEEQVQLLQFATGTSRVPWGGFSNLLGASGNQLFTICRCDGNGLPTASTCFNMLKLPEYGSKEELSHKLKTAITCGAEWFEFT